MAQEDRAVLPTLDAALGAWCLLPDWMRREHADIRAKIVAVRKALQKAATGDPDLVRTLADEVARLDALLTIHLTREDQWLYPIAKLVLSKEQWSVIDRGIA